MSTRLFESGYALLVQLGSDLGQVKKTSTIKMCYLLYHYTISSFCHDAVDLVAAHFHHSGAENSCS